MYIFRLIHTSMLKINRINSYSLVNDVDLIRRGAE